jgi:hypothetical protein
LRLILFTKLKIVNTGFHCNNLLKVFNEKIEFAST